MFSVVIERQLPIITVFSPFLAFPFLSFLDRVHALSEKIVALGVIEIIRSIDSLMKLEGKI